MSGGVWYAEPVAYRGTRAPWQHACGEVTYLDELGRHLPSGA